MLHSPTLGSAICSEPWPDESGVQQTFNDYDEDVRSGTTKDRIRLKDSYWRADFDEDHIYQCGLEQACRAKEKCGNGNCATAGNSICKLGYLIQFSHMLPKKQLTRQATNSSKLSALSKLRALY